MFLKIKPLFLRLLPLLLLLLQNPKDPLKTEKDIKIHCYFDSEVGISHVPAFR